MTNPVPMGLFPGVFRPAGNVQPFTYRDGATYLEILMDLRKWIANTLVPFIDQETEELAQAWQANVEKVMQELAETLASVETSNGNTIELVNDALAEQSETVTGQLSEQNTAVTSQLNTQNTNIGNQLSAQNTSVANSISTNKAYVDAAVASIINATIAVSDPVITSVLNNVDSNTRKKLDELFGSSRYNGELPRLRKKIAQITAGQTARLKILAIGDSNTEGDGAVKETTSWPANLARAIIGAGIKDGGTGLVYMRRDGRWNRGNWMAISANSKHGYVSVDAGQAVFVSDKAGTFIDYYYDGTTGPHVITVDEKTDYTAVATANVIEKMTISGLADTIHSVAISPGVAGKRVYGVDVYRATGVSVSNAGISGTSTQQWRVTEPGEDNAIKVSFAWAPDLVYVNLGTNDFGVNVDVVTFENNLRAIYAKFAGVSDFVFGTPIPRADSGLKAYADIIKKLSKEFKVPLIDLYYRWGDYTTAKNLGYYSDDLHGNAWSFMDIARAIADHLKIPVGLLDAPAPAPMPLPGTLVISDSFNRTDGAVGSVETGGIAWQMTNGAIAILNNRLKLTSVTDAANIGARPHIDSGLANCRIYGTVYPNNNEYGCGLTFRYDKAAFTGWTVEAWNSTTYKLRKHTDAGTFVEVAVSNKSVQTGDKLSVILDGNNITVKANGVTIMTAVDAFNSTKTQHGFVSHTSTPTFDDFSVRTLV